MSRFAPTFTINNAITAGLTTIERARGFLEAATLSDEWVRRMSQRALLLEAHHTTHIEGTHLTIEQAEPLRLLEKHEARIEDLEALLPNVNRRTLQRALQVLVQRGVAKPRGAARAVRYTLKINGLRGIATVSRHESRQIATLDPRAPSRAVPSCDIEL